MKTRPGPLLPTAYIKWPEGVDELHHYTTLGGLEGIIASNTIWATSFKHLNDATEVNYVKEVILRYISPRIRDFLQQNAATHQRICHIIKREGGLEGATSAMSSFMIRNFHGGLFEASEFGVEPFITSFCSHHADSPYERENGLLSQWRGYSTGAGVCVVFDVEKFSALLAHEAKNIAYTHFGFIEVVYDNDQAGLELNLPFLLHFQRTLEMIVRGDIIPDGQYVNEFVGELVRAACSVKHRAFSEEREVRIVATPLTDEYREFFDKLGFPVAPPSPKIHLRGTNHTRYVTLNAFGLNLKSTIRRVIVGPSHRIEEVANRAREILNGEISVVLSRTPLVTRVSS